MSDDARSTLDARLADADWAKRYTDGSSAERLEFKELTAKIADSGDDSVLADVLAGKPGRGADHDGMRLVVGQYRSFGLADGEIATLLSSKPATKEEFEKATLEKRTALGTKAFTDLYMSGSLPERQQVARWDAIISKGIQP